MVDFTDKIKEEVFLRRPVLSEIYNSNSKCSLKDYVQRSWEVSEVGLDPIFLEVLKDELALVYGNSMADAVIDQVSKKPLVSTVDHHGIWGHPIFVNSDLIYSLHFKPEEFALCLSTESVSLNNTSSWSGSLLYHNGLELKRHSFFVDHFKTLPVFSVPAISTEDIERFAKIAGAQFESLIESLGFKSINKPDFSGQASLLTSAFWQKVFPSAPKLLYVPLESLILKYLLRIFESKDSFLSKIILTQEGRNLWKKYFPNDHTFLFWGIDAKGRRQVISKLPDSADVIRLMKEKKIYPSSPLCFAALLNAGMVCAGGFNQTTWLTESKIKLMMLLEELGGNESKIENIKKVPTTNFAESSLAWLKINGDYKAPSAADLFFTGIDMYPKYLSLASSLSLDKSMDLAISTIYSVVVPQNEQVPDFNLEAEQKSVFDDLQMVELLNKMGI